MSYKIRIRTIDGDKLTFRQVSSYEAKDGLLYFTDAKTGRNMIFSTLNAEIEEEDERKPI